MGARMLSPYDFLNQLCCRVAVAIRTWPESNCHIDQSWPIQSHNMPQIMTETGHRTHCSYLFLRSRKPKLTTRGPYKCPASPECANGISLGQTWRWNQRICTGTNMFFRPFLWLYIDSCQMVSVGCPQVLNFTRLVGGGANSSNKHESRDWDIMISSFHLSWYRDLKQTRNINN